MTPYYEHAGIAIYHGDCREILPCVRPGFSDCPALLMADPPYGISHSTHSGDYSIKGSPSWMNREIKGDDSTELRDWLLSEFRDEPIAMFGSPKIVRPPECRMILIWDKGAMCGMGDVSFPWKPSFEEIYIFGNEWSGRRDEAVLKGHFTISWESAGRTHQHQKPISLLKHIIGKNSSPLVIDPCFGSGSALVAAKQLGKSAIGIEIEEKYCEIAAKRLSQEVLNFEQ